MTERQAWGALPAGVRDRIGEALGGPVRGFAPVGGGFSVGGVVGVVSADGRNRMFIKAVTQDHPAAEDYRIEARVAAVLPAQVVTPALRLAHVADGWVVLGYEPVSGRVAHEPWVDDELDAALATLRSSARLLTPAPEVEVPSVVERMDGRCETWRRVAERGHCGPVQLGQLGPWERANLARLAELERGWVSRVAGNTLLHFDLRHDNCLIGEDGRMWFVDWGRACLGPPWIDLACLLLESDLGGRDPESLFARHELGAAADAEAVDGFLVALASYWTHVAALPPPSGAAHLRRRQEHSRKTTIRWLMRRWSDPTR